MASSLSCLQPSTSLHHTVLEKLYCASMKMGTSFYTHTKMKAIHIIGNLHCRMKFIKSFSKACSYLFPLTQSPCLSCMLWWLWQARKLCSTCNAQQFRELNHNLQHQQCILQRIGSDKGQARVRIRSTGLKSFSFVHDSDLIFLQEIWNRCYVKQHNICWMQPNLQYHNKFFLVHKAIALQGSTKYALPLTFICPP